MSIPRPALLEDLDERQDDVMQRLDALNEKIELLLRHWTANAGAGELLDGAPSRLTGREVQPA